MAEQANHSRHDLKTKFGSFFSRNRATEISSTNGRDDRLDCENVRRKGVSQQRRSKATSHIDDENGDEEGEDSIDEYEVDAFSEDEGRHERERGTLAKVGQLYRDNHEEEWDEWAPDDAPRDLERTSRFQQCAIVVRRERRRGTSGLPLHSIIIHSPLLRKTLDHTFDGYEGISTKLKETKFYAPFHEFYYRWHRFESQAKEEQDAETKKHLELLYPIISQEILPHIKAMEDHVSNGIISFELLWTIFPPGADVYSKVDNQDRVFNLKKAAYRKDFSGITIFSLACQFVDTDGDRFGYKSKSIEIFPFEGTQKITDLVAIPSQFLPEKELLVERMISRGRQFEQLKGFNHVSYAGHYVDKSSAQGRKLYLHSGRVIVDAKGFATHCVDSNRGIETLGDPGSPRGAQDPGEDFYAGMADVVHRAAMQAFKDFEGLLRQHERVDFTPNSALQAHALTARQQLHCTPMVKGFCLASKKWAEFYVDNIRPIDWQTDAFKRVVLPYGYKEIIYAFVQEQLSQNDTFDDIIQGKGQGFILLLSGQPGVGKTLTAESVAEEMRKPLYSMSAGELGEDASEIEKSLDAALELNSAWQSILLIDECDIFLEQRTPTDIQRNRLVSIFLKQLEYYRGVMILTTNRVSCFDPAFESRIHLTINYPSLNFESRMHIWEMFTLVQGDDRGSEVGLGQQDLQELASHEMNGRQIKNVVKTARLLAKQRKQALSMDHFGIVLKVKNVDLDHISRTDLRN